MEKKKQLIATGLVLLLFVMIIGISYAMYTFAGTGTKENVISVGKLSVSYAENTNIELTNKYSETDSVGIATAGEKSTLEFSITSDTAGNENINYAVGIDVVQEGATLTEDYVKIYMLKDDALATGFTENTGKTIASFKNNSITDQMEDHVVLTDTISGTDTHEYEVKAWVSDSYDLPTSDTSSGNTHSNATTSETFKFKIKVAATTDEMVINSGTVKSNPNAPELATNMIPVYYDGSVWRKADSTNTNATYKWYDYDEKMWANAVTVTESNGVRTDLTESPAGTEIPMERINTMMVWIPRFSAEIGNVSCSTISTPSKEQNLSCYDIGLEPSERAKLEAALTSSGVTDTNTMMEAFLAGEYVEFNGMRGNFLGVLDLYTQVSGGDTINATYTFNSEKTTKSQSFDINFVDSNTTAHGAFTFGTQNLNGFWISKFEVSTGTTNCNPTDYVAVGEECNLTTINPYSKPNVSSWQGAMVSTFYQAMLEMKDETSVYGFDVITDKTLDTHMIKNSEWGAVAYLTYSLYGRCTSSTNCSDIGINNSGSYVTGMGAPAGSNADNAETNPVISSLYNTKAGMDASTTGNIYGVYDMSGGASEYVMGVYWDGSNYRSGYSATNNWHSGFNGYLYADGIEYGDGIAYPSDRKYFNLYTTEDTSAGLQHALVETAGWYGDSSYFVQGDYSWFRRGGYYYGASSAGVFCYNRSFGDATIAVASRFVLVK